MRTDGGKCFKGRICKEVFYLGKRFERDTSFTWFERRRPYERCGGGTFFDLDVVDEALLRHVVGVDSESEGNIVLCDSERGGDTRPFGVIQFDGGAELPFMAAAIPDDTWIGGFDIEGECVVRIGLHAFDILQKCTENMRSVGGWIGDFEASLA